MKKEVQNGPAKSAHQWGSIMYPQNEVAFVAQGPVASEKNTVSGSVFSPGENWFFFFPARALFFSFFVLFTRQINQEK